jgi:hypothetical protein
MLNKQEDIFHRANIANVISACMAQINAKWTSYMWSVQIWQLIFFLS